MVVKSKLVIKIKHQAIDANLKSITRRPWVRGKCIPSVKVDRLYKYRISKNAHHYENVFYLKKKKGIEEIKVQ